MQMEIEGQEIVYKDLSDLRDKLTNLVGKTAQEREVHEQEAKRLRHMEKKLRLFLGGSPAAEAAVHGSSDRTEALSKGAAHE